MVEDQVHPVVLASLRHAELTGLETKAPAQLEQKTLQVIQQGPFQRVLRVFRELRQAGELEDVRVAQHVGDGLRQRLFPRPGDHGLFVPGQTGALVEQAFDLALELALGPVTVEALLLIESPFPMVINTGQFQEMGPRET